MVYIILYICYMMLYMFPIVNIIGSLDFRSWQKVPSVPSVDFSDATRFIFVGCISCILPSAPFVKWNPPMLEKKNLLYWYIHFCWQNVHCGHIKHHLNHLFRTIYILHCLNPSVFDWYSPFLSNSSMWVFPTFFCRSFSGNGLSTSMLQIFKHSYRMGPPRYNGV
jgi:hypothetical protein